ncbi:RNA-directed DNA polymerase, eukaryota, reverse transcriptase zinc-binding domain protein [Tanacetum coccineum]
MPIKKEGQNSGDDKNGDKDQSNKTGLATPSREKEWNVDKDVIEAIRKSANKYALLEDHSEDECLDGITMEDKGVVDKFVNEKNYPSMSITNSMCNREKQKEIRRFIQEESPNVCTLLETHIKDHKLKKICDFVYGNWSWKTNMVTCDRSCRIVVGLNPLVINMMLVHMCDQAMLYMVENIRKPWILMGDWNVSLNVSDHPEGGSYKTADMLDPGNGILKKIDRVLGNSEFMGEFPNAYATFLPHLTFDHCRAIDEEKLLFQQAKIEWLKDGDRNSKFLHAFLKCKRNKSRIAMIKNELGETFYEDKVPEQFVEHFRDFLGKSQATQIDLLDKIHFDKTISQSEADWMTRQVTNEEIKQALFDILPLSHFYYNNFGTEGVYDNNAPDGFSSRFYKKAWENIKKDVCAAVKEFFKKGRMLGKFNATLISLIPKLDTPTKVSEFRPIACCNTLYKCLSKKLTERIKKALCYLVDPNQSALCRLLTTSC